MFKKSTCPARRLYACAKEAPIRAFETSRLLALVQQYVVKIWEKDYTEYIFRARSRDARNDTSYELIAALRTIRAVRIVVGDKLDNIGEILESLPCAALKADERGRGRQRRRSRARTVNRERNYDNRSLIGSVNVLLLHSPTVSGGIRAYTGASWSTASRNRERIEDDAKGDYRNK